MTYLVPRPVYVSIIAHAIMLTSTGPGTRLGITSRNTKEQLNAVEVFVKKEK